MHIFLSFHCINACIFWGLLEYIIPVPGNITVPLIYGAAVGLLFLESYRPTVNMSTKLVSLSFSILTAEYNGGFIRHMVFSKSEQYCNH